MEAKSILFILLTLPLILAYHANAQVVIFDITNYGATPDTDISQALSKAWRDANASENPSEIVVPIGTWKLSQATLEGPNLAPIRLEIKGTIRADPNLDTTLEKQPDWITIDYVNFFTLSGVGVLDGQGQQAWKANNCTTDKNCKRLPFNLSLNRMRHSVIRDVTSKDSKFFHINCNSCMNVSFTRLTVSAPDDSPNTDGIHVVRSKMVNITDSVIETGDDCISMGNDLTHVYVRNVTCGPGHGISIGSLGKKGDEKDVTGIYIGNCTFINTTNGVRIKTFPSSPPTLQLQVSDVHYQDLIMVNAYNPIIIDQNYCPNKQCDPSKPSLVQISNVMYNNVRGSTTSKNAVTLSCSSIKPCKDVRIGNVELYYVGKKGEINTTCANVQPTLFGKQIPPICATQSA